MSAMLAIINPGDEVVIFEPLYENYGPDAILSGASPRFVRLHAAGLEFDPRRTRGAFGPKTKAIILNTPNNPTGKVFTRAELEIIRDLCLRWNAYAITDEIYEHMVYDGAEHISMASLEGMRDRTITINGAVEDLQRYGLARRLGHCAARSLFPIRKVHDFLTVGAAAPLQQAGAVALQLPQILREARERCTRQARAHAGHSHRCGVPVLQTRGAYYIMTDISGFGFPDDVAFAKYLVAENRRRCRSRLQFLPRSCGRAHPPSLHILQDRKNVSSRRRTTCKLEKNGVTCVRIIRRDLC